jgi:hypothetical protein
VPGYILYVAVTDIAPTQVIHESSICTRFTTICEYVYYRIQFILIHHRLKHGPLKYICVANGHSWKHYALSVHILSYCSHGGILGKVNDIYKDVCQTPNERREENNGPKQSTDFGFPGKDPDHTVGGRVLDVLPELLRVIFAESFFEGLSFLDSQILNRMVNRGCPRKVSQTP